MTDNPLYIFAEACVAHRRLQFKNTTGTNVCAREMSSASEQKPQIVASTLRHFFDKKVNLVIDLTSDSDNESINESAND